MGIRILLNINTTTPFAGLVRPEGTGVKQLATPAVIIRLQFVFQPRQSGVAQAVGQVANALPVYRNSRDIRPPEDLPLQHRHGVVLTRDAFFRLAGRLRVEQPHAPVFAHFTTQPRPIQQRVLHDHTRSSIIADANSATEKRAVSLETEAGEEVLIFNEKLPSFGVKYLEPT